jgi:hypothetical protein
VSPRLRTQDREALGLWLWTRVAVFLVAAAAPLALAPTGGRAPDVVRSWARWDADLLRKIAEHGYAGRPQHYPDEGVEAFFPGFPLLLRAVHVVVPEWTVAGLLVSLVAGAVACVALVRLAALDGVDGGRAVLLLLVSPSAVFLAAGYTEALFLALALPAWLAARSGRWPAAGLLAAGACLVRVNGAFLALALVVLYLTAGRAGSRGRIRRDVLWLLTPLLALLGYAAYLRHLTGDWLRWFAAQEEGWGRRLTPPWDSLAATVDFASGTGSYAYVAYLEIAAVAAGLLGTGVLLWRRRWAEATYVGLSVAALATSTFYFSVARSSLLWFPLWVLLAAATTRRPWLLRAALAVGAPLMVLGVVLFATGRWAG